MKSRLRKKKISLLVEELEPRILYSADAAAVVNPGALTPSAEVRTLDAYAAPAAANSPTAAADAAPAAATAPPAAPNSSTPAADTAVQAATAPAATDVAKTRHELAFVDTQVADYQKLIDSLIDQSTDQRQIDIVLLDADHDGIEQISAALQNRHDIDAVHIFSHGIDGAVELGSAWLNTYSLEARADAIGQWGKSLTPNADILLYGCDVAADGQGQALVNRLSQLTGADVAASTNLTGDALCGGGVVDRQSDK